MRKLTEPQMAALGKLVLGVAVLMSETERRRYEALVKRGFVERIKNGGYRINEIGRNHVMNAVIGRATT